MKQPKKHKELPEKKYAAILIRGLIGIRKDIKDTLFMLGLRKKHACVLLPQTDSMLGMLRKAQSYIAFGEVSNETVELLIKKRSKKNSRCFALAPPKHGFERKGIKMPYSIGGALGYRAEKINDLIKKMI
jgi:large subunit ribosomal protein L30